LKSAATAESLSVYTEVPELLSGLTDSRFKVLSEKEGADVMWLLGNDRQASLVAAHSAKAFVNEFPRDSVLLNRESLSLMVQSIYTSFDKSATTVPIVPETYSVAHHLPAFIGRVQELESDFLSKNVWSVGSGPYIEPSTGSAQPDALCSMSSNTDWVLRFTESTSGKVIQRVMNKPMVSGTGNKLEFKVNLFLRSIVPL